MLGEGDDLLKRDLLIDAAVPFARCEPEDSPHEVARIELDLIAEERSHIGVGKFVACLLQDNG